jgi:hypothetical protein
VKHSRSPFVFNTQPDPYCVGSRIQREAAVRQCEERGVPIALFDGDPAANHATLPNVHPRIIEARGWIDADISDCGNWTAHSWWNGMEYRWRRVGQ